MMDRRLGPNDSFLRRFVTLTSLTAGGYGPEHAG